MPFECMHSTVYGIRHWTGPEDVTINLHCLSLLYKEGCENSVLLKAPGIVCMVGIATCVPLNVIGLLSTCLLYRDAAKFPRRLQCNAFFSCIDVLRDWSVEV